MAVNGQEATPEVTDDAAATTETGAQDNTLTIADQVSINGMVMVESVIIANAGFIVIHADENGMPGHVVGIACYAK
jgi:hypothetical protein